MPRDVFGLQYPFLPRAELLSFEEITRLTKIFVDLGVRKVRLTGGEPLLRKGIEHLVADLSQVRGLEDLTLTTNGSLLGAKAKSLKEAGLRRITVSLDALDDDIFRAMNDVDFPVARVLSGINAAQEAGLNPVKVNMVVKRGVNETQILPMAQRFRGTGQIVRFIEYMDVGSTNGWRLTDVVSAQEIVSMIGEEWPLNVITPSQPGEVATRYRYSDGMGEIGVISSVTVPFCRNCVRARLSAKGELFTCLFGNRGHDLRALVRNNIADTEIREAIRDIWSQRRDRYSEIRSSKTADTTRVEMSYIGG